MKKFSLVLAIFLGLNIFGTYAEACGAGLLTNDCDAEVISIEEIVFDDTTEEPLADISNINNKSLSQEELEKEINNIVPSENITISYNGKKIDYDVLPQYINGKLMIPVRQTLETMGYEINWNQEEYSVEILKEANYTKLYIGDNNYIKNKMSPFSLSEAPIIKDSRTLVPVEFFHEVLSLGLKINDGNIEFIENPDDNQMHKLVTHSGFLVKAERGEGVIRYHLSEEKDREVSLIITIEDKNSFYQQIPVIGEVINIISSPIMLMSYPGQTGGFIAY